MEQAIIEYVRRAVSDSQDRDDMLREFDALLEGVSEDGDDAPWRGACTLNAPVVFEAHLTLRSMLTAALRRDPKVVVEAQSPEDEEDAQAQEAWIVNKSYQCQLDQHLDTIIAYALKYPTCPVFVGWGEEEVEERVTMYKEKGGGEDSTLLSEGDTEEGVEYEEIPYLQPELLYSGVEIRPVDLQDFYFYPTDARTPQKAFLTAERMLLSSEDLVVGIERYGYDAEAVKALLDAGPTEPQEGQSQRSDDTSWLTGVHSSDSSDSDSGFFECFLVYTRLPALEGVPDHYLNTDFCCVVCPEKDIVLRLDFSTYQHKRPYASVNMLSRPDNWYGWCLPQMLYSHQKECTANIRFGINCFNFQSAPVLKAKKGLTRDLSALKVYPGAILPFEVNPNEIEALVLPQTAGESLGFQQYIKEEARALYSSGGFGQLPQKQRRNAEIQNVQVAAASKFDEFLSQVQIGLVDIILRMVSLNLKYMPRDGEEFLDEFGSRRSIKPSQLRGKFIYRPTSNSQNANPELRIQLAKAKSAIAEEYATFQLKGTPPEILKRVWHAKRNELIDLGEHNPEAYLGKEPKVEQQPNPQVPQQALALQNPQQPGGGGGAMALPSPPQQSEAANASFG